MKDNPLSSEDQEQLSWINKEVLEEIIKNEAKTDKITICDYKKEYLISPGENYASNLYRICVIYEDPSNKEKELWLVVKTITKGFDESVFFREKEFYEIAKPNLERIFKGQTGTKDPPLIAPRYFPCNNRGALIMEEMRGYKMANRREGYSLSQIQMVIKNLAKFHAMSLAWFDEDPTVPNIFTSDMFYTEEKISSIEVYFSKPLVVLAEEVESWPGYQHYKEKLLRYMNKAATLIINSRKPNAANHFVCIHGDCWLNNILINEEKVVFIDFQAYHWAPAAIDITQLFYTSLCTKERQKYFDSLIQLYVEEIQRYLKLLHLDPNQITYESLRNDCLAMLPVSLSIPLCFYQLTKLPPESEKVSISSLFNDEYLDPNLPWRKAYRNEEYINEMKMILDEADNIGIFNI